MQIKDEDFKAIQIYCYWAVKYHEAGMLKKSLYRPYLKARYAKMKEAINKYN